MKKLLFALCVVVGAALGAIAGSESVDTAPSADVVRSQELRAEVDRLRERFADVKHDLDAATTPAAATAARAKLFQLRVDMVVIEDEIAVLAGRMPVAVDF